MAFGSRFYGCQRSDAEAAILHLRRMGNSSATTGIMSYRVISFTMAQVRQGSLGWHRQLGSVLRERPDIKVYSASPFDLDERRKMKDRFGGDIVYFFNEAACMLADELGLNLEFAATIPDDELPKRRSVVVGLPERRDGASLSSAS